ncbi:manganese-dependent inorganic pyrophosphatase [Sinobaca qinghaiensis]|uniref:Probable manganese-dependent inorganic pyrophosphatase n=1 Tax=Sinobaca qinghaiensis TaxID=342944 RepID=A0A419V4N8_9BACL|nr:manganese-dependent inorganic pyrophosphatase [Sinobaca qinghaiensis]RKD73412.1 manganese-dependent inorganic pyrophosphatase [Sinobaca qinghaiensis]
MSKLLVFGHKSPDTDTICSAIAHAALKNKTGDEAEAVRLGEINGETQYALDYFKIEAPRLVESVSNETDRVSLVDHNEAQQSVDDLAEVSIKEVIDHHRIANFQTSEPLYYRAEPVGCTATILNKMYKEYGVEIDKSTAGLMLSAIISDSLLFKSPTCTHEDVAAAEELAGIAGVDTDSYGLEMLKAGADISGKTEEELISLDAKEFSMGNAKVQIAQVNAIDPNEVLERQTEIEKVMNEAVQNNGLDLFVFVVTDILNSDSIAVAVGEKTDAVEKAFNVTLSNNKAVLEGVVSRKKQIVPVLTDALK